MFSYYGAKTKIIDLYPKPRHSKIIEPFAGSARYALKYFDREVLLVDKFDAIVNLWKWMQLCSKKDILSLPDFKKGNDLRKFDICPEAKLLIGFCIGRGNSYPVHVGGNFSNWNEDKLRIANSVDKIKHWKILKADYQDIPNQEATWYIDPPYQFGGHKYKYSSKSIDFKLLSLWCRDRQGQVIVCENTKAEWMDFKPMVLFRGAQTQTTEAVWCNHSTVFDHPAPKLF